MLGWRVTHRHHSWRSRSKAMHSRIFSMICRIFFIGLFLCWLSGANQSANQASRIDELINRGEFAEAEKLLREQISDASAPITSEPGIQLEVLRRTRYDFALSDK